MEITKREPQSNPTAAGPQFGDYLFILFRHRRKILWFTLAGLLAATVSYLVAGKVYESQAKLLVRYVVERSAFEPGVEAQGQTKSYGSHSKGVIDAEVQILTSWDLAYAVADKVEKLSGQFDGNQSAAAVGILKGLTVMPAGKESNVIGVSYRNSDPALAREVLTELVDEYFDKHLEIHRSANASTDLQTDVMKVQARLKDIENQLNEKKATSGIISLEGSTASLHAQMTKVQEDLITANADVAVQTARVQALAQVTNGGEAQTGGPDVDGIQKYQTLVNLLAHLRKRKIELLVQYHAESGLVIRVDEQIAEAEAERRELATRFPDLAATVVPSSDPGSLSAPSLAVEQARLALVEARKTFLEEQSTKFANQIADVGKVGTEINELERRKKIEEDKVRLLESSYEQALVDEKLRAADTSEVPNIAVVQKPSAAMRTVSKSNKIAFGLAGAGLALGVALALFIDLFLDRKIRRPEQIEAQLRTPFAIAIPHLDTGLRSSEIRADTKKGKGSKPDDPPEGSPMICPWEGDHFIRPYTDSIRYRLSYFFERHHMTHKPKMIAVTSFSEDAGTSTLAAGLAASCSEPGYGKVLLVDMNGHQAETHSFFEGKPVCTLPEALRSGEDVNVRFKAVEKYLFLASTASGEQNGANSLMPKDFYDLMPQFKLSDFDYIIFDMPRMSPTSPTVAMAGFMDKVLLIAEAGVRAAACLSRASIFVVSHSYLWMCVCGLGGGVRERSFDTVAILGRSMRPLQRNLKGGRAGRKARGSRWF